MYEQTKITQIPFSELILKYKCKNWNYTIHYTGKKKQKLKTK